MLKVAFIKSRIKKKKKTLRNLSETNKGLRLQFISLKSNMYILEYKTQRHVRVQEFFRVNIAHLREQFVTTKKNLSDRRF